MDRASLIEAASNAKRDAIFAQGASDQAFLAVLTAADTPAPVSTRSSPAELPLQIDTVDSATVKVSRGGKRLQLELQVTEPAFVSWLERKAPLLINELHERWKREEE